MTDWRDYLTPAESRRYDAIPAKRAALSVERHKIYRRALERMRRAQETKDRKAK